MILLSTGFGEGTVLITMVLALILLGLVFYKHVITFISNMLKPKKEQEEVN